jgi:hypothetical protein
MKKNKRSNTPKRKRLKKEGRLQTGNEFIKNYTGKRIVKGYANWYGVSLLTAVNELKILGVAISEEYIQQLKITEENKIKERQKRREEKALAEKMIEDELERELYCWNSLSGNYCEEFVEDSECKNCKSECACSKNDELPF